MVATVRIAVMSRPVGAAGGKDGEKSARKRDGKRDALARSVLSYISKPTKDFSLNFTLQKLEYSEIIVRFLHDLIKNAL